MDQRKIGAYLKELRQNKKMTQQELAEKLGVSNRSVSRWETGATMPDFDLLIELARFYDIARLLKARYMMKLLKSLGDFSVLH